MTTITVPFLRGTTAQNDAYKGTEGEITIDTEKKTLRLHDGVTQGGFPLLNVADLSDDSDTSHAYLQKSDIVSNTVVYRGEAVQGSADTGPVWRIRKITITYGSNFGTTSVWADNSSLFTKKWSDRKTYNYNF